MTSGRVKEAFDHADELLGLAQRLGADDLLLEGHHAKWSAALWCGRLTLRTNILDKVFHDTTARIIMPSRSPSVVMIPACAPRRQGD